MISRYKVSIRCFTKTRTNRANFEKVNKTYISPIFKLRVIFAAAVIQIGVHISRG